MGFLPLRSKGNSPMTFRGKSVLVGAMFLAGTVLAANAQQPQYQPYLSNQLALQPQYQSSYNQAPASPPSWSYDPYTSGFGPCPQRTPTDSDSCREQMPPSYGQPDYRPH
jgi:hypothetical protein